jgi:DNA-binding MarR family transcriptional regulator
MDEVARKGVARLMHETSLPPKLRAVLLRLFLHGGTAIGTMAELASLLGVHRTRLARVIEAIELSGCVRVEQVEPSGRSKRLRLEIVDEEATQAISPEPPGGASSVTPEAPRSSEDPPAHEHEEDPVGLVGKSQAEMEALLDQVRDRELLERVIHCAEGSLPLGERLGIRRRVKDWIRPVTEQQERKDATQENLELAINKALLQTLRQIDSPSKRSDGSPKWKNWFPKAVDGHLEPYERSWESNANVDPAYRREE